MRVMGCSLSTKAETPSLRSHCAGRVYCQHLHVEQLAECPGIFWCRSPDGVMFIARIADDRRRMAEKPADQPSAPRFSRLWKTVLLSFGGLLDFFLL